MGQGHDHAPNPNADHGRAFLIATTLNMAFVVLGAVFGFMANSTALLADAAHNLGYVLGLVLAWGASVLSKRGPSSRRTYGLRRSSILAAFLNSALLLFATGGVAWEAIRRFHAPAPIASKTVMIVAAVGVIINLGSSIPFLAGRKNDLNIQAAFLHLMGDAAFSFAVVIAGAVMYFTGWTWLDPVMSLVLAISILIGTWKLLRGSINLILDAVPENIDPEAVRDYLERLPGVTDVHHLHIWPLSTTETALTAHLVMPVPSLRPDFLANVAEGLRHELQIAHTTLQVDVIGAGDGCAPCTDDSAGSKASDCLS
ncbi:MAG: cation diffusion facilitator family transporter [Thermoanaerobaculia bacterium]